MSSITSSICRAARSRSIRAAMTRSRRQYAERLAQLESARASQAAQRAKLQDYIARNSARASTAKQAQSRVEGAGPDAADRGGRRGSEPELRFPESRRSCGRRWSRSTWPRSAMRRASRSSRASICGSIPTTASRCWAATATARPRSPGCSPPSCRRWKAQMTASGKMRVGYFTQYQVEELDRDDTPARAYEPADAEARRRPRCARSSAASAFPATRRPCRSARCRAASARGWRWR